MNSESESENELLKPWQDVNLKEMRDLGVIATFSALSQIEDFETQVLTQMEDAAWPIDDDHPEGSRRKTGPEILNLNKSIRRTKLLMEHINVLPVKTAFVLNHVRAKLADYSLLSGDPSRIDARRRYMGIRGEPDDVFMKTGIEYTAGMTEKYTARLIGYCGIKAITELTWRSQSTAIRQSVRHVRFAETRDQLFQGRW